MVLFLPTLGAPLSTLADDHWIDGRLTLPLLRTHSSLRVVLRGLVGVERDARGKFVGTRHLGDEIVGRMR
jgi:hypothetical protein